MKKFIGLVLAVELWLLASEFLKAEILIKSNWINKFQSLGLVYPEHSVLSTVFWLLWVMILATGLVYLAKKLSAIEATVVVTMAGFGLTWISLFNFNLLPVDALPIAIPFTLVEIYLPCLWCHRLLNNATAYPVTTIQPA